MWYVTALVCISMQCISRKLLSLWGVLGFQVRCFNTAVLFSLGHSEEVAHYIYLFDLKKKIIQRMAIKCASIKCVEGRNRAITS